VELGHHQFPDRRAGNLAVSLLLIDVCSSKVVGWDLDERKDRAIAADLVSLACLRERISKGRKQPLILNSHNMNVMCAAILARRLKELSMLKSASRPRVSNDVRYS